MWGAARVVREDRRGMQMGFRLGKSEAKGGKMARSQQLSNNGKGVDASSQATERWGKHWDRPTTHAALPLNPSESFY